MLQGFLQNNKWKITKELFVYNIKYLFLQIIYEKQLRKKLEKEISLEIHIISQRFRRTSGL